MKTLMFIFVSFLLVLSQPIYSQWKTYDTHINTTYNEVCVVNSNLIWAAATDRMVVRSTDGGLTWVALSTGLPASFEMMHITAIDVNTAWVSGSADNTMGRIFKTTNGGQLWFEQPISDLNYINKIHFFNANTGIMLKDHNWPPNNDTAGFYITRNGGSNWYHPAHQPVVGAFHDNCMNVCDSNFIYYVNFNKLYVLKNGLNNSFQVLPFAAGPYAVSFRDSLNGLAAGFGDTVYRTTNGGLNWHPVNVLPSGNFTLSVTAVPGTQWYLLSGTHYMVLTYNSGVSFQSPVFFSDSVSLGFSHAIDTNSFWVPASHGVLFKYNFAYIGIRQISESVPEHFALYQNYPNPFNPSTKIMFELPVSSDVILKVYDVTGREVYKITGSEKRPGMYTVDFDGSNLASGVYFYSLTAGNFSQVRKMVILQ